ncbi:flagellar assembly protein FliW [Robertmurraya korlensis]|uniref:flagellar assembly protein FliW n=1 Tax=Robertmurraya korlensis TaxID=519977 RepID=UPI00203BFD5F|nr:flagellar assembly protein FliW [Robertmurraya korlensis]MCM3602652.1 flagellar assembly protein FliW [Robertmurraya korlensis]
MIINTKYHGEYETSDGEVLHFPKGIPGFPDEKQFVIIPLEADDTFMILQSVKTFELAFVLINPFQYFPNYDFTLDETTIEKLAIHSPEDIAVYSILTVHDPFEKTTANLQAPVIINLKNKRGKQVILNIDTYTTRHNIMNKR